ALPISSWPDGRPAAVTVRVAGGEEQPADAFGVVTVPVPGRTFDVEARDASGRRVLRRIDLDAVDGASDGFVLRTDRVEARGGDTLNVTLLTLHDAVFYLDLVRGPATLLTKTLRTRNGRGEIALDLPADAKGTYVLSAWKVRPEGSVERQTLPVYVRSADELRVTPTLARAETRPGEEIVAEVRVTDRDGRPVPSALGVSVVDEAVWALSTARPGMEQTFFDLREDALKPRFQVQAAGLPSASPARIAMAEKPAAPVFASDDGVSRLQFLVRGRLEKSRGVATVLAWASGAVVGFWIAWMCAGRWPFVAPCLGITVGAVFALILVPSESPSAALLLFIALFSGTVAAGGAAWRLPPPGPLRVLAAAGGVVSALLVGVFLISAFVATMTLGRHFPMSGLADSAQLRLESKPIHGADLSSAAPRLREFFPETLYWNPEIVTDDEGRATLRFPGADSITTWRMGLNAVSRDGRLGAADAPLRVFQPFFVDLDLPVALTQGDEIWLPVAVYNYLPDPQSVALAFEVESGFEILDGATRSVEVAAGDVTSVHVHIRAREFGRHRLQVTAVTPQFSDAVRRTVEVFPDGRRLTAADGGMLSGSAAGRITVPAEAIDGASTLQVRLFPSRFADLVTGLDSLARMPYG
ncbi:MAG: hypothetical protein HUU15_14965, partial [Candidatus Brocadiae bacterium]|nr:hypothetical protein [Candidatus Brocadiia bacterium]